MKIYPTRNKEHVLCSVSLGILMVMLLRLEVVPNALVQSLPLKQAFWAQLLILEAPIKIP
jgi:hypothetical protein